MAIKQTEKTVRAHSQWVKITRDGGARQFTFARGDDGALKAKEVQSFPFSAIPTWADATVHAAQRMASS